MVDRIVHRNELQKSLAFLLRYFAAAAMLPQKPRRRAGETLARFRAVGGPIASTPAPQPAPPPQPGAKPEPLDATASPSANGEPPPQAAEPPKEEAPGAGSAAFPADREIPIRE
jgi:hypothetical protein